MTIHHLVIVQLPDCYRHSANTFVINEFMLTGWLKRVAMSGSRMKLTDEVTANVAAQLADALERIETTPQDEIHDALCGCPAGGKDAFVCFLRGGGFVLVDGETTTPDDLR